LKKQIALVHLMEAEAEVEMETEVEMEADMEVDTDMEMDMEVEMEMDMEVEMKVDNDFLSKNSTYSSGGSGVGQIKVFLTIKMVQDFIKLESRKKILNKN
jgi:uncharacterized protein YxjI